MTEFVLISCSKSKRDDTHLAKDLYDPSPIFRKRRRFARQRGDSWGVLSARFGYLRPWDSIETYDTHIRDRDAGLWAPFVLRDLLPDLQHLTVDCVVLLAGRKYVDPLVTPLESRGYDVVDYNCGKRPGERMAALDDAIAPGEQTTLQDAGGGARR